MAKWRCERCDDPCTAYGDTEPKTCPYCYPYGDATWVKDETKPRLFIDHSGGVFQQIIATQDVDIIIIDYEDLENDGPFVVIDGVNKAYLYSGASPDIAPDRVEDLFKQIRGQKARMED